MTHLLIPLNGPIMQAELFVLTPLGPQTAEPARRRRLVDKRNQLLKLANNLAQPVDPEFTLEHIQCVLCLQTASMIHAGRLCVLAHQPEAHGLLASSATSSSALCRG